MAAELDEVIFEKDHYEMFFVRNDLVATQPLYRHAFMRRSYYGLKNYYCMACGEVWGRRVDPNALSPLHSYEQASCKEHGGDESMLTSWEWAHIDYLSSNVLAYLILTETQEVHHDESSSSI